MKLLRTLGITLIALMAWSGVARSQSWQPLQHQPSFGASTALLLTDGTVMVQQVGSRPWWRLTPDINGSYVNGTWSQLASLPSGYAPLYYGSAVLSDGRVIVEGGEYNFGVPQETNLGAIYDPLTNVWTPVTPPSGWANIGDGQSVVLANGVYMQANALTTQEALFNAQTLTWTSTGTGKADANSEEGWTLLPNRAVLTTDANNSGNPTNSEWYNPLTGIWKSAGSTIVPLADPGSHEVGPAVLRPDGTVWATGGTGHTAIFNTATHTWAVGPDFPNIGGQLDIADGPASLVPSGNVFCVASPGIFQPPLHFFEFDGTNLIQEPGTPNSSHKTSYEGRMLLLPTGQVLFTDGTTDVEVYTPVGSANSAWAPTIISAPATISVGGSYTISGTQFNGMSQAVAYGDDAQAATNYPLVRIINHATGHVFYTRTHGHSVMGVATGSRRVGTHFDVPAGVESGASDLEVVADGIASNPVAVTVQ